MADNLTLNAGSGGATLASDDVSSVHFQKVKIDVGGDGVSAALSNANPIPVSDAGGTISVDDGAGSITVDGTVSASLNAGTNNIGDIDVLTVNGVAPAFGSGARGATVQRVTIATDDVVPVSDNGGSLTVDGAVTVTQTQTLDYDTGGGTATTGILGIALPGAGGPVAGGTSTNPLQVSLANTGANATAVKVDGSAATQPVSGTVTANLAAGSNNIGDVDVLTVPADPFGVNADAASATGSISAKLRFIAGTGIPITGTVTVGSHAVTNAGTFLVQENGSALTALQKIDDPVLVDDAGFTPATSSVMMAGFQADEASTDSIDEGDAGAARMTLDRKQIVTTYAHGAGGASVATGTIAATKTDIGTANTAGTVLGWYIYNPNASVAYVQFFNTQASGVTLGTTAPVYSLGIPATSAANIPPTMPGIAHATAISIAVTTTRSGSTGPGSTVDFNIWFKQ